MKIAWRPTPLPSTWHAFFKLPTWFCGPRDRGGCVESFVCWPVPRLSRPSRHCVGSVVSPNRWPRASTRWSLALPTMDLSPPLTLPSRSTATCHRLAPSFHRIIAPSYVHCPHTIVPPRSFPSHSRITRFSMVSLSVCWTSSRGGQANSCP